MRSIWLLLSIVGMDMIGFARCESVTVEENTLELHFMYLVQTRNDRLTKEELVEVENILLHNIQVSRDWTTEGGSSTIIEIDSLPIDSINTNGESVLQLAILLILLLGFFSRSSLIVI